MMTLEDYAIDTGKTVEEIKALCDKVGISYQDENTLLDDISITLLDNEMQDEEDYIDTDVDDELKEEINKCGISDDILNRINYFNQSKLSNLRLPGEFADIVNDINKASAKLLNNGVLSEEGMDNIISWQFSDDVLDNSTVGLTKSRENLINFVNYYKENQSNMVRQNQQVMSKVA